MEYCAPALTIYGDALIVTLGAENFGDDGVLEI